MAVMEEIIKERIEKALQPSHLEVINESHLHQGHAGDDGSGESHFKLIVASGAFFGKQRIECHRMIYHALGTEIKDKIHALSIETRV